MWGYYQHPNSVIIVKNGRQLRYSEKPYCYILDHNGEYRNFITGERYRKETFSVISDLTKFVGKISNGFCESKVPFVERVVLDQRPIKYDKYSIYDIETLYSGEIIMVSIYLSDKKQIITIEQEEKDYKFPTNKKYVIKTKNEYDLLQKVISILLQYECMSGYNNNMFDDKQIVERAKLYNLWFGYTEPKFYNEKYTISGVSSMDYMRMKHEFYHKEMSDNSLETFAKFCGVKGKLMKKISREDFDRLWYNTLDDNTYKQFKEVAQKEFPDEQINCPRDILRLYNIEDVNTLVRIENKEHILETFIDIANMYHVDVEMITNASRRTYVVLQKYLKQYNYVMPSENNLDKVEFGGGSCFIKTTGLIQETIHNADVKSMYPSIVINNNLSPEPEELGTKILPIAIRELLDERDKVKKQIKDGIGDIQALKNKSTALKYIINALTFGVWGDPDLNTYCPRLASRITEIGRQTIDKMSSIIETNDGKVLYGDTDGVYFTGKNIEKILDALKQVDFEIEYESFKCGFFYKKKKYVLLKNDDKLKVMGLEATRQGDNPLFTRELFNDFFKKYLTTGKTLFDVDISNISTKNIGIPFKTNKDINEYATLSYKHKAVVAYQKKIQSNESTEGNRYYIFYLKPELTNTFSGYPIDTETRCRVIAATDPDEVNTIYNLNIENLNTELILDRFFYKKLANYGIELNDKTKQTILQGDW